MPVIASPVRILVVEDETFIRMDVVETLRQAGFHVVEATNADEAVQILERDTSIQLMFTDIEMPGSMNGLKLAAAVRDRWPPVKIIATSGRIKMQINDVPAGARFFAKPYGSDQLLKVIQELFALANDS